MFLTPRTSLALAVALAVAHHGSPERPVGASVLVRRYQLPKRALEPVLQQLGRMGVVQSARGLRGGYFVRHPQQVRVGGVVRAFQSESAGVQPLADLQPALEQALGQAFQQFLAALDCLTLADLTSQASRLGISRTLEPLLDFEI